MRAWGPNKLKCTRKFTSRLTLRPGGSTFHGLLDIALGPLKRGGYNTNYGPWKATKWSLTPNNVIVSWWDPELPTIQIILKNFVAVPQHGPLPLHTKVRGLINDKIGFLYPKVQLWDDFQGPLDDHGHNRDCTLLKIHRLGWLNTIEKA